MLHLRAVDGTALPADMESAFATMPGVLDAAIDTRTGTWRLETDARVFRFRGFGRLEASAAADPA